MELVKKHFGSSGRKMKEVSMRNLVSWSRPSFYSNVFSDIDRLFNELEMAPRTSDNEVSFTPAGEIFESEDHFALNFDLPGMKRDEIKIEVDGNRLSVSGERKREVNSGKKEQVQRLERSYGFFRRIFTLPSTVNTEKIDARYENGVLELKLPKTEQSKSRRVEIQDKGSEKLTHDKSA
jgi:HSP20 family protein